MEWGHLRLTDRIRPGVRVLFVGINPGMRSAAIGHHFAGYSNRFWKLLYESGLVPERIDYKDDDRLPDWGYGITNIVARASARADELTRAEIVAGGAILVKKVRRLRPAWLAVLGIGAYRAAFARPDAVVGPQPRALGDTRVWVLPNPSGLNAHFQLADLARVFGELRAAVDAPES
jgi:TDG/mug DNA glycosylase family protein